MKTRLTLLLMFLPGVLAAAAVDQLKSFAKQTQSASAEFNQIVLDSNGRKIQEASGTMAFARPGKFRWVYEKPYEQLIVGDGKKLWVYDKELNQVTVRELDQALGSTPAALLAGDAIEESFNLDEGEKSDGIEWLVATPKTKESSFQKVLLGFRGSDLAAMELKDHFGQTTKIEFSEVKANPKLSADLFQFEPPQGADVIGE
ncbi:MAG: outer membrane lipoprotein chaperone LolA [Burkholderiales bacterium]